MDNNGIDIHVASYLIINTPANFVIHLTSATGLASPEQVQRAAASCASLEQDQRVTARLAPPEQVRRSAAGLAPPEQSWRAIAGLATAVVKSYLDYISIRLVLAVS